MIPKKYPTQLFNVLDHNCSLNPIYAQNAIKNKNNIAYKLYKFRNVFNFIEYNTRNL